MKASYGRITCYGSFPYFVIEVIDEHPEAGHTDSVIPEVPIRPAYHPAHLQVQGMRYPS